MTMDVATTELKTAIRGTVRRLNFYNGRLLTAEDLGAEQATCEAERHQLARILGEGVATGLEVAEHRDSTVAKPVVTVAPGLAVTPSGKIVELTQAVDLQLLRSTATDGAEGGGLFADCMPAADRSYSAGRAVYLLTVAPATFEEGAAPATAGSTARCGPEYSVESVRFRLVWIGLLNVELLDGARLRNRIAHRMFGTDADAVERFRVDPRVLPTLDYGLLADLRASCLTPDEVPLATIGWRTPAAEDPLALRDPGIQFVDVWSARRPLAPDEARHRYPLLSGRRRRIEAEAAFLQFTDEIEDLYAAAVAGRVDLATTTAASRFLYLPAVGIVPLLRRARRARSIGVDPATFFGPQALPEGAALDADLVAALVHEGTYHDPIRVGSDERIQLYVVWENYTARDRYSDTGRVPDPVVVFAKATIPYRGTARFDHAQWSQSRFARVPL